VERLTLSHLPLKPKGKTKHPKQNITNTTLKTYEKQHPHPIKG
jgi:hypothetical protein